MLTQSFEFFKENLFIKENVEQPQNKVSNHMNK